MMRFVKPVFGIAAVAMLAGCVTVIRGAETIEGSAKRMTLVYAAGESSVLLELKNNPFGGDDSAAAGKLAELARGSLSDMDLVFTSDRAAAARPEYRFVFAFDPAAKVSEADLCAPGAIETDAGGAKTRLITSFCSGTELLASAIASGDKVSGFDDPVTKQMVHGTISETINGRASINRRAR